MPRDQNDMKRNRDLKDELYKLDSSEGFVVWGKLRTTLVADIFSNH